MIRRATIDDAGAIARIHVQTWRAAYAGIVPQAYLDRLSEEKRTTVWRQDIQENRSIVLVALDGEEIAGWASGGESRDEDAKGEGEVYAIYVAPHFWRRNFGSKLIAELEKSLPPTDLTLWVLRENLPAIQFYENLGYYPDGAQKELVREGKSLTEIRVRKKHLKEIKHHHATSYTNAA